MYDSGFIEIGPMVLELVPTRCTHERVCNVFLWVWTNFVHLCWCNFNRMQNGNRGAGATLKLGGKRLPGSKVTPTQN